jgi:hypothetical protein
MSCVPAACSAVPFFFGGMVFCVAQTREVKNFSHGGFSFIFWKKRKQKKLPGNNSARKKEHGRDNAAVHCVDQSIQENEPG